MWSYRGNTLSEEDDSALFSIPEPHPSFRFPEDDGSHPDFRIEWWYVSAHLFVEPEVRYGLQATFFRLGHGSDQYFMSHMAVSNGGNRNFQFEERLRPEGRSAFSETGRLHLENGPWQLSQLDQTGAMRLNAGVNSDYSFDLQLSPVKDHVVFGSEGVTRKSGDPTVASYYLTYPRIEVSGSWRCGEEEEAVSGEAWMDHEIASRQLADDQTGWDWIQIQFFDGWELMAYVIRGESSVRSLTWIDPKGEQFPISSNDFSWEDAGVWKSWESGAVYPIRPTISVPDPRTGRRINLQFFPLIEEQELRGRLDIIYWEGAGDIRDGDGKTVGRSFLELTGYAGRLGEILR